jgi:hypothetical protein
MPQRNIFIAIIVVLALLAGYLGFQLQQKNRELSDLVEAEQKRASEVDKAKAARARVTPSQFGYYIAVGEGPLVPLQLLTSTKQDLPLDQPRFLDKPQLVYKAGSVLHLVLYNRIFSMAVQPEMFFHILAKVKGDEAWVLRNRGYTARVSPRPDNRDMLDIFVTYKPGRYGLQFDNQVYSFTVEGDNDDPDFCVEKHSSSFQNAYVPCPGGHPD